MPKLPNAHNYSLLLFYKKKQSAASIRNKLYRIKSIGLNVGHAKPTDIVYTIAPHIKIVQWLDHNN